MSEKIQHILNSNKVEIAIFSLILTTLVVSFIGLLKLSTTQKVPVSHIPKKVPPAHPVQKASGDTDIWVDISGAVMKPGTYSMNEGARLADVIHEAKGLSHSADVDFFNRNFNNARFVSDQEKIYIPRHDEVEQGIFLEGRYIVDHAFKSSSIGSIADVDKSVTGNSYKEDPTEDLIDINTSSLEDLDTLPGVGAVTAKKIIENRPYETVDDLLEKKSVGESVYNNIKSLVKVQ